MQNEKPKGGRTYYGQIASQFKGLMTEDKVREMLNPNRKKKDEGPDKRPMIVRDPQAVLVASRLRRFEPAMLHLAKNLMLNQISQDDFLISVRNEARTLMTNLRAMQSIALRPEVAEKAVRDVVLELDNKLTEIGKKNFDLQHAKPITAIIISGLSSCIQKGVSQAAVAKPKENIKTGTPLDRFPPEIRRRIYTRLTEIGLNPYDFENLKRVARNMGVKDPDALIAELEKGNIPDELKKFL